MPSAESGPDQKHALEAQWRKWVFPLPGIDRLVALHSFRPSQSCLPATEASGSAQFRLPVRLFVGAMAVIRYAERHGTRRPWLVQLLARRTTKVAAAALANKTARMVWAIMTSGQPYREPKLRAA